MKLYIDNKLADIEENCDVSITLSIASLTNIESGRTGYSKSIRVPMTRKNRTILGDIDQINAVEMYNQQNHNARIEVDGSVVIDGAVMMTAAQSSENGGWYYMNIIGASKLWVKRAAESMFKEITILFNEKITPYMISQSWDWDKAVKFFPVQRDKYMVYNSNSDAFAPTRILSFEDYHPFINARELINAIMSNAGYSVVSQFLESDYFKSLYVSGAYPVKSVENIKTKMDFKAGRFTNVSAVADRYGRVKADPATSLNSIGNIVETADPKQLSEGATGTTIEGVFNTNNCFQKQNNTIVFVAPTEVVIGFEYKIMYTTDYYMISREELKGFNTIVVDSVETHQYKIINRFADRRNKIVAGYQYNIIVFGHLAGNQYQFRYDTQKTATTVENVIHATFSTRTSLVVVTSTTPIMNTYLYVKKTGSSTFVEYEQDWAIYDGYVKENDKIEVEVNIRSTPNRILPSKPKFFNNLYFGGADPGMTFTLDKSTTMRPVFASYPALESSVNFAEVAAHQFRQIDFVNSIKQLFNLYFYTDNLNKEVYIEPRANFHDRSVVVDWSEKLDRSMPVTSQELGADMSEIMTFMYQDGDGAVARWDEMYQQKFGRWRSSILNKFAKEGEKTYVNPMFRPSMNRSKVLPDAPNAVMLQVGDRNKLTNTDSDELNFPPKIVRYIGQKKLPGSQLWGWPAYMPQYPAVVFHSQELGDDNSSLCFEDRDGLVGLHRFYDSNIDLYNKSKKITAYLNLKPHDIEPLINPNELKHDFRAMYRLRIDGETSLFFLEEVCDYNPCANKPTKCIFIKDV